MIRPYIVVIPARYQSSRFPGKPLAPIAGKSLIHRVWERCIKAWPEDLVYIATDDSRISDHCKGLNIQVVMTGSECLTGTDRVYEVAKQIDAEIYINVQGDEPLISPDDITTVIHAAIDEPGQVINAMCPIYNEDDFRSPSVPKVVAKQNGQLMYMSRAAIPTNKALAMKHAFKQVCIYAFPKEALVLFGETGKKTQIEAIEDIEILRFLELGINVKMVQVSDASIAVDFPDDISRVEKALRERLLEI